MRFDKTDLNNQFKRKKSLEYAISRPKVCFVAQLHFICPVLVTI